MQVTQFHAGQSLEGVQQFLTAHADIFRSVNQSDARKALDAAVTQLRATAAEQDAHARDLKGKGGERARLEAVLVRKFMTPLSKWARSHLQGDPALEALTPSGGTLRRQQLVVTAEGMLRAATPYATRISTGGFPAGFLDGFRAAVDALQAVLVARKAKNTARTGATESIAALVRQGREAVTALDALVSHQVLGDPRLEREWAVAKRIRKPNSFESVPPVPAPQPSLAATGTQEVLKAA
jgi:hypothetical protein